MRSLSARAELLGAFLLAAGASVAALLTGSEVGAIIGVSIAGLVGVLILGQLLASERRRHEVAEEELAGQASFLESLVDSFGTIASTLEVEQILGLTRSEAERLFAARASLLEPGEAGGHEADEHELLLPLSVRGVELARLRLVRDHPFDRDDVARGSILADFAARAVENAQLLAEVRVREADRARLSDRLITAEQEERRRLAVYLHDTSVQSLSGITLMLDAATDFVRQGRTDEAQSILDGVLDRQRAAIRGLRDLSFNLEPVVLRDQGFGPAVHALASQLGLEQQIKIEVDVARAADARGGEGRGARGSQRRARDQRRRSRRAPAGGLGADPGAGAHTERQARGRGGGRRRHDDPREAAGVCRTRERLASSPEWATRRTARSRSTCCSSGSRRAMSSSNGRASRPASATRSTSMDAPSASARSALRPCP